MGNCFCFRGGASPTSSEECAAGRADGDHEQWVHSTRPDSYERWRLSLPYDANVVGGAGGISVDYGGCPEKERLLGDDCSTPETKRQVKINITRRELEELLSTGWLDFRDNSRVLSANQLLARLVLSAAADSNSSELHGQGSWRPSLQSIPEVD